MTGSREGDDRAVVAAMQAFYEVLRSIRPDPECVFVVRKDQGTVVFGPTPRAHVETTYTDAPWTPGTGPIAWGKASSSTSVHLKVEVDSGPNTTNSVLISRVWDRP